MLKLNRVLALELNWLSTIQHSLDFLQSGTTGNITGTNVLICKLCYLFTTEISRTASRSITTVVHLAPAQNIRRRAREARLSR